MLPEIWGRPMHRVQKRASGSGQTYAGGAEICPRFRAYFSEVGISCPRFRTDFSGVGMTCHRFRADFPEIRIPCPRFRADFTRVGIICLRFRADSSGVGMAYPGFRADFSRVGDDILANLAVQSYVLQMHLYTDLIEGDRPQK